MTKLFNCSTIQRVKAYAFTLAETLIVIGIIGVVAALTLPNLNHATGDKEKVTKVKKIYASLTDAVDRAQAVYGPINEWFTDIENDYDAINEREAKRITEFMKISKDCGVGEGCISSAPRIGYDGDKGDSVYDYLKDDNPYMVTLSDGMSLIFLNKNVLVDIDGPNKGKNQNGSDLFGFILYDMNDSYSPVDDLLGYSGNIPWTYSFASWVIQNGNLDYLKADYDGDGDEWTCRETGKILDGVSNTSCN